MKANNNLQVTYQVETGLFFFFLSNNSVFGCNMTTGISPVRGKDSMSNPLGLEGRNLEWSHTMKWLLSSTPEKSTNRPLNCPRSPSTLCGSAKRAASNSLRFTAVAAGRSQGSGNETLPFDARHQPGPVLRKKLEPRLAKRKEDSMKRAGRSGPRGRRVKGHVNNG